MPHPFRVCGSPPLTVALGLAAAALLGASSASAQTPALDAAADAWRFQLTPYVWMTGLEGRIRPFRGAPTVHVDRSFSDVLEHLDTAAFVSGTARTGAYVLQGDVSHATSSAAADLPMGLSANARVRQSSLTLTGGRHWAVDADSGVDLMAGLRLWDIQATVQVPGLAEARSSTQFADPLLALRWRYALAPRWSTLLYADAGGFGLGSEATWQLLGTLNYQLDEQWFVSLGYRQLSVNYRDGGKRLDFRQGGPVLGATFRF